ncbi:M56 family metallopeptidase [Sphingomonas immobilis]|uniref:M56 family metallopeptidase n=1 Tax=Sphingomonas immobilis TaxID=3063997 RepID=A0ABT8ZV06_9SPHN|nr:M56 family metallopeptidase [Sphingomonas sp. CA1-15]MDO7841037.1 M56 family metallopeptidase [Sphingomonas sp. CA1-15]
MIAGFTGWAIEALLASAALMLLVLAIRRPVRKMFGPDVAYALWALPVLRLCLPPLPQEWRQAAITPVTPIAKAASEQFTVLFVDAAPAAATAHTAAAAAAEPLLSWAMIAPAAAFLWFAGALYFIIWHTLAHNRFCKSLLADAATIDASAGIRVIESDVAKGPLAFGVLRRYVAFPRDFGALYEAQERDLALAHELGHHARGDLVANWVALVVLALHWFNPVAWYAFRAFRADQEVANDARVLAGRPAITRHTYACAILKAAHGGQVSAACHLHTIDDLKGRLRMLTTNRVSRVRLFGGASLATLLGVSALALTASGTQAAEHMRISVKKVTGVDIARLDPVAPIAAAVAPTPVTPVTPIVPGSVEAPAAPLAPVAPQAQPAPAAVPAPPAPPVPPAPDDEALATSDHTEATDGRITRRHYVRVGKDGRVVTSDSFPDMPEIASMNCTGDGGRRQMVIHQNEGDHRKIIICTNRIQKMAAHAAEMAANAPDIERRAYASALDSLRAARARMAEDASLAGQARAEALGAMDQSIAELQQDLARAK